MCAWAKSENISNTSGGGDRFYLNFTGFPFPLGPFLNRQTVRSEAVKNSIWLFEQEQALGFSSVSTNIRMTVIKLKSGGLWIHTPIAPTKECIQVKDWIDRITRDWAFKRITPAHFAAPVNASRSDFIAAFGFLDELLGEHYVTRPSLSIFFTSLLGKAASYFPPDE